jgi:hypothetical protein
MPPSLHKERCAIVARILQTPPCRAQSTARPCTCTRCRCAGHMAGGTTCGPTHLLVAARAMSTNHSCELSLSVPWNTYSLPHNCQPNDAAGTASKSRRKSTNSRKTQPRVQGLIRTCPERFGTTHSQQKHNWSAGQDIPTKMLPSSKWRAPCARVLQPVCRNAPCTGGQLRSVPPKTAQSSQAVYVGGALLI